MVIKRFFVILLVTTLLFLNTACSQQPPELPSNELDSVENTDTTSVPEYDTSDIKLKRFCNYVVDTALPYLVSLTEPSLLDENGRVVVECLPRARQSMIGREVTVFSTDQLEEPLLYCFEKQPDGGGRLTVLYYASPSKIYHTMLLTLDVPYETAEQLLATDQWSGTITTLSLIAKSDYSYPAEVLSRLKVTEETAEDGLICFGSIALDEIGAIKKSCFFFDTWDHDDLRALKITFMRFGLIEPYAVPYTPEVIVLDEMWTYMNDTKLAPLPYSPDGFSPSAPGERPRVETLCRARQDLVGRETSVQLYDENGLVNDLVFCYQKTEGGKGWLAILFTADTVRNYPVMLVIETDYASAEELLAETEYWSGTVTAVKLISLFDYMYPSNTVFGALEREPQSTVGPICYGAVASASFIESETNELVCLSCNSFDEIQAFGATFNRFDVLR